MASCINFRHDRNLAELALGATLLVAVAVGDPSTATTVAAAGTAAVLVVQLAVVRPRLNV